MVSETSCPYWRGAKHSSSKRNGKSEAKLASALKIKCDPKSTDTKFGIFQHFNAVGRCRLTSC